VVDSVEGGARIMTLFSQIMARLFQHETLVDGLLSLIKTEIVLISLVLKAAGAIVDRFIAGLAR